MYSTRQLGTLVDLNYWSVIIYSNVSDWGLVLTWGLGLWGRGGHLTAGNPVGGRGGPEKIWCVLKYTHVTLNQDLCLKNCHQPFKNSLLLWKAIFKHQIILFYLFLLVYLLKDNYQLAGHLLSAWIYRVVFKRHPPKFSMYMIRPKCSRISTIARLSTYIFYFKEPLKDFFYFYI